MSPLERHRIRPTMPPVDLIKATDDRDCVSLDSASHWVSFSLKIACSRFEIVVSIDYSKFLVKYVCAFENHH